MRGILVLVGKLVNFPGGEADSGIGFHRLLGPTSRSTIHPINSILRFSPYLLDISQVLKWENSQNL